MIFPTGKPHVSYSEIKIWKECTWKHKKMYIDKVQTWEDNPYAEFGTIIHDTIENYLKTGEMNTGEIEQKIGTKNSLHG